MTGKQIILDAIAGKNTPRPAWLPFVGVHGGKLIDQTATDYLKSADNIVKGLTKAVELYRPDGLPIAFDLQLEAEVLGCQLNWADKTPPSVTSHPMSAMEGPGASLEDLPAFSTDAGRFPIVWEATRRMRHTFGDQLALYGLLTGPFTLTSHLMGTDLFLQMFDDEELVLKTMAHCTDIAKQVASRYLENGADIIAVVDPMTSQISPEHFEQFVAPSLNDLFSHIREKGGLSSLFVCGDATRNLEVMAATACDNVSIDEQIDLNTIRELTVPNNKSFGGNLKLTVVLLMGDTDDAKRDAIHCIDTAGDSGFILAPGCDLPYDVKPENLQAVAELVHDPYQRDVARTLADKDADDFADIQLPDYNDPAQVTVDVITLDSASCAPCQYMFAAATDARSRFPEDTPVVIREHKITTRQGVGMMSRLNVGALPSICIDGELAFASVIPDTKTLADRIARRLDEKQTANA
ncbi:uroporphyrinogen decarboxylase family protein [Mucisphaera calidilacus]|uniref:Uroporphyrinogen decarboxylase n=1 Tax=Mucisphaera calidilacus TaxID=2527982 RepID=A0A518BWU2_9BACT|nr:uroporphyrinogen decarboxylase family protein [Mucisphaera calidilacus]QDU71436.1 Uroporphyrinogen decarboxylase [Mucisphaera calidilacus]